MFTAKVCLEYKIKFENLLKTLLMTRTGCVIILDYDANNNDNIFILYYEKKSLVDLLSAVRVTIA